LILLVIFSILIFGLLASCNDNQSSRDADNIAQSLSGSDTAGFKRADAPRHFIFPEDFGPHPEFQTEWWYYTGNLTSKEGRDFGYQLTFFRRALSPQKINRESKWSTNQIYFAHFALSDITEGRFYSSERWGRDAMELAGVQGKPFRIWIDNWSIEGDGDNFKLHAEDDSVSINLSLKSMKPTVLQGDKGLSQKTSEPGNASYYFSQTRINSSGTITLDEQKFEVSGLSWLDREWSTSALGENQEGWDWFSIQLDDRREIMLYQLRSKDGGIDSFSSGSLIGTTGEVTPLKADDFEVEVLDIWKSSETGSVYPSKWGISIPKEDIKLTVIPFISNQELLLSFIYWEGAVKVSGDGISGKGYVELIGY